MQEQSEGERKRVQQEWTRYRRTKGRDNSTIWGENMDERKGGFQRGSQSWWRQQYYEYEYAGAGGVRSMESVTKALEVLGVSDAGDASAIRAAYLR
jgi:hypothetical protein